MSKRSLPFATKNTDHKKQLEKETYRLAQATLQYIEEQDMSPEEVETSLQEGSRKFGSSNEHGDNGRGERGLVKRSGNVKSPKWKHFMYSNTQLKDSRQLKKDFHGQHFGLRGFGHL